MDAELFMKSHMREMVVTKEEQRKMILKLKEESKKKRHLFLEGEFQAERKIGEGSFGLVHKGKYENELVAAKEMVIYKKNYRRIKNETYFLRKLKHPHITKFLGIYVNDYSLNFLFECMEGGDLGQFIFSCRKRAKGGFFKKGERMEDIFPIAQRYSYLVQILWGLQYIHSKNIIHRDIKLENIVLSKDLKVAKLCDFGVARKRKKENEKENEKEEEEEGEDETSLLLDSKKKEEKMSVIGTKLYLAPEVRNRSYDTEVDIYAFGIVGIHVLTTNSYYTKALQCYSRRGDLLQFFGECLGEMEKVDKIPLPVCEQIGNSIKTKPEERPTAGVLKEFFVNFIAQSDLKNSEFVKPFLDDWMDGTIKPAEKKNQPINDSVSTSQGSEN